MAIRKKDGENSEVENQDKPSSSKKTVKAPATGVKKTAAPKSAAAAPGEAETPAPAKKRSSAKSTTKSAADAATKAVKSVAKKITDAVSDLTSKKKATAAKAPASKAAKVPTPKRTRTVAASTPAAEKVAPKRATSKSRTTVGALGKDVTNADVAAALLDSESSGTFTDETDIADRNPVDVKEHFFQEHRQGPPMPETRELPQEYGDSKIVLLVRDPEWVYAYWELNDATRAEFNLPRQGHNKRIVIRLYNITGRNWPEEAAHYFQDVDVSPYAANWYVKLPEVSQKWCAEIGMFDEQNEYVPIVRSNVIDTPRNSISEHTDSEWMVVEESFRKLYSMSGGLDVVNPNGGGVTMRGGSEMIIRQLQRSVTGLLSAEGSGLSSGSLYSGNLVGGNGKTAKDFWLQVHTELILYGATEPTARVTVQGQPVRLNEDGTFSLRFSLPDGEQVLTVHATNADGDMERQITPVVNKTTK